MAFSIIFTTYARMVLKSCSVNEPLYYAKLVLEKGKCLNDEKFWC